MTSQLSIQAAELPKQTSVELLKDSFASFHAEAATWKRLAEELIVNDESQTVEMAKAREGRLALKKLRTSADMMRKDLKAEALSYGNAVQDAYNEVDETIRPIEKILELKEKFSEIKAAERFKALKAQRDAEISPYIRFVPSYANLALLTDDDYALILSSAIMQSESEKQRIADDYERFTQQIAEQAEEDKRQSAEREVLRLEMVKLREQQAEANRLSAIEKAEIAVKNKDAAEKAAEEQKLIKSQLDAERAERKKVEDRCKEIEASALKKIQEEKERKQEEDRKAANAPEKSKLIALAIKIESIEIPILETFDAMKIGLDVQTLLNKVSTFIREKSENL